jgi:enterochelin esterase-like enzyme
LIYDQRLPAMAAVMIDGAAERSLEYDTVSSKYVEFVEAEVLPRAEQEANVMPSNNPDARMTLRGSSGGAVVLTISWFRSDLYHRILTYSGTFVIANPRLAKLLEDKGYVYQFVYSKGAGHTQRKVSTALSRRQLEYVWIDYRPQR